MEADMILQKILPAAEEAVQQLSEQSIQLHHRQLSGYAKLLEVLNHNLVGKKEDRDYLLSVWKEYGTYLENVFSWVDSIGDILDDFSEDKLWADWEKHFYSFLSEYPGELRLTIPDSFWLPRAEDTLYVRLIKGYKRFLMRCKKISLNVSNAIRKLFHIRLLSPIPPSRTFQLHHFLRSYLEIPVSLVLMDEWQHNYQLIATHLVRLHDSGEVLKNSLLMIKSTEKARRNGDISEIVQKIEQLNGYIRLVETLAGETREFQEGLKSRLAGKFRAISADFIKNWEHAGTFVLPGREFGLKKIQQLRNDRTEKYTMIRKAWGNHFDGEKEEWLKDLELSHFQVKAAVTCIDIGHGIERNVIEKILPAVMEVHKSFTNSLEKFNILESHEKGELTNRILSESHSLLDKLRQEEIPALTDAVYRANIELDMKEYPDRIQKALELISEKHKILLRRDLENLPPKSETDEVSLKKLVREEIIAPLIKNHEDLSAVIHKRLEQSLLTVSGIDQIVEFNLHAALTLLQEGSGTETFENARNLVQEGLERTQSQLQDLDNSFRQLSELIQVNLQDMTVQVNNEIQELEDSNKVFELKIRLARAQTREKIRNIGKNLWNNARSTVRSSIPFIIGVLRKIRESYVHFRKITGLAVPAVSIDEKLSRYLTEFRQKITRLPYVYQRLFSLEPLTDKRFFAAREEEMDLIKKDFIRWREGKSMSMVIVGERGSGKTTLINFAESDIFENLPVIKINLTQTIFQEAELLGLLKSVFNEPAAQTFEELEERLIRRETHTICVVENIHKLFLRTVEGFDAIERFLLFVAVTQNHIFWVVTFSMYGWQYLEKVLHISAYFNRVLELGIQSKEEMTAIILKRHRLSGYSIVYEIPEELLQSRKFRKMTSDEKRQEYLEDMLFGKLTELSAGNIRVAMLFWLMAVTDFTKDRLVISPKIEFEYAFIYQLPSEELFTLAALIQHETLDAQQHSLIFHQDLKNSLLILNRMLNRGLLQKNQTGYFIHPFLYRPVVKALKSKNMLH